MSSSYDQDEVTIIGIERNTNHSTKIFYSSMLETLYYCPGANIIQEHDGIYIEFVRCSINDKCEITHPAQKDKGNEFILINNVTKPLYIKGENGATRIPSNGN
ncbi:MAG: hypothetical protein GY737_19470 [Desulfobacteraceae bacterium]|nr:hypothetical protein [Desulfobacteraceae bacterium]